MIKFQNSKFKAFEMNAANYDESSKQQMDSDDLSKIISIFTNYNEDYELENSAVVYGFKQGTKFISCVLKVHKDTKFVPKTGVKINFDDIKQYVEKVELVSFAKSKSCKYSDNKKDQVIIIYKDNFKDCPYYAQFERYDYYKDSVLPKNDIHAVDIDISKLNF